VKVSSSRVGDVAAERSLIHRNSLNRQWTQSTRVHQVNNNTRNLYKIDVGTGAATVIGATGISNPLGLAYVPDVPEPRTGMIRKALESRAGDLRFFKNRTFSDISGHSIKEKFDREGTKKRRVAKPTTRYSVVKESRVAASLLAHCPLHTTTGRAARQSRLARSAPI